MLRCEDDVGAYVSHPHHDMQSPCCDVGLRSCKLVSVTLQCKLQVGKKPSLSCHDVSCSLGDSSLSRHDVNMHR